MVQSAARLLAAVLCLSLLGAANAAEPVFKPLFDGQTLTGWRGDTNFWRVENGAVVAESTEQNPCKANTFLVWDQGDVDDFELRLKFRITGGESANSGIQFRGVQREDGHVVGYQADIDRKGQWIGCLYDEAMPRKMLASRGQKVTIASNEDRTAEQVGDADELLAHVKPGEWNEYTITARGNVITLALNGHRTVEVIDNDPAGLDRYGKLALQLHAGPPMKVEFKDIELRRFPLSEGWKKIVFVAGTPSHGYFQHEHNAGCLLLADKLNAAAKEHGLPVVAAVYTNGWPKDTTAMDNVDCVVSYCDGGQRHYLNDRLDDFDYLVNERRVGLVCIHYAVETTPGECGEHFLKWIGGYFEPNWSVNPHWTAKFDDLPKHPITQGVNPFEINDEWYYHMRFVDGMKGVTPILTDLPPRDSLSRPDGPHSGNPHVRAAVLERMEPQHVAWAYERPNGKGRGFGFTGGHFHQNWQNDDFRKLVLNAIVWTAQLDVPADGVASATPTQEELEQNRDPKPKPGEKPQADAGRRQRPRAGRNGTKPAFQSKVVDERTPGHAVDLDIDITGAERLWLIVTDGGDGFSCDWADWAEPRLASPANDSNAPGELRLTDLKWKAASSQWGRVNVNKNADGGPLRIAGKPVAFGIGTHANSLIEFELPKDHGYTRFRARAGLDNGGTDQGGATSVEFLVYTQRPGPELFARLAASGSEPASHESALAVEQLEVHPELEATLFASEPMMTNPASIDVDHLGRVWVCEAINYRSFRNADVIGDRKVGDRILVLEDTNGDAVADKSTVFYQGHDVDSAHGILVLPSTSGKGLRAIVSALDSVFYLIDDNGDLQADRKEILFTGIDGSQHDHGIHAFHFGPDGKLYFNFGNAGKHIKDKQGKPIVDKAGREVNDSRQPYQEGMVFRCNLDGSEFETLAWNFRNNWEVCVDSFGTIWQSDNDDDGNRGVRINYVMEYGNYGYKDELTGAGWREPRTNMEAEIPLQHWHLNDPGVIPNLLQTGAGAPTGICIYEGDLLPKEFRGAMIHCDAGPNICRAYVTTPDGAGYTAEIVNILDGARNKWFRPSDVCVAPDGSLLVADWYDPGVGGHRMQDAAHGRVFRVAPPKASGRYSSPKVDVSTPEGAVAALVSPNMTCRYLGWTALHEMGSRAAPALQKLWRSADPVHRARALGVLAKLEQPREQLLAALAAALKDPSTDVRCFAIRLGRQHAGGFTDEEVEAAIDLHDPSPAVRRELLIALRERLTRGPEPKPFDCWAELARQYDGKDRWYLEALGLAADGHWNECLAAYFSAVETNHDKRTRDIIWRSRGDQTSLMLTAALLHPETPDAEVPRLLRSLDFQSSPDKQQHLLNLAFGQFPGGAARCSLIHAEALQRIEGFDLAAHPERREVLLATLESTRGTPQYVRLVDKFHVAERYPDLLALAQADPQSQVAVEAVKTLLARQQLRMVRADLTGDDEALAEATLAALATAADGRAVKLLFDLMQAEDQPLPRRRAAVKALGAIRQGAVELQKLAEAGSFDERLRETLAATLHTVQWKDIKEFASKKFPLPPGKNSEPVPPIAELSSRSGDVTHGSVLFHSTATCAQCHQVGTLGKNVGPNLSEIGKKLSKEALLESILYPSAAISHNYENWLIVDSDGNQVTGLLVSETDAAVELKDSKGIVRSVPRGNIEIIKKQDISLMPADLQKTLSVQDLVDIVEYMTTLK